MRSELLSEKENEERESKRGGTNTDDRRQKTNRLISLGREAVKRTDNCLRYSPKIETFPAYAWHAYLHIKLLTFA